ncbi:hypothetical protein JA1_004231 [Spathaspora sp. JA1]|nr:hypothetical protein JA1_004231 [Spathaspora sp. JA1]
MSASKPKTPVSSPKSSHSRSSSSLKPSTPSPPGSNPGSNNRSERRNIGSAGFLRTPEQSKDHNNINLPFTPSFKRFSGSLKSPDYKLNYHNVNSPYSAANALKTPRRSGYDSDDEDSKNRKLKLQKTPQFFGTAKKLFENEDNSSSPKREDLIEISSQLKIKLSSALGKLQRDDQTTHSNAHPSSKISFTELSFDPATSPTKKQTVNTRSSPGSSFQRANLNLQTLQNSPIAKSQEKFGAISDSNSPLKQSPRFNHEHPQIVEMPSPDEELSAQRALLAALSRQRRRSITSTATPPTTASRRKPSLGGGVTEDTPSFTPSHRRTTSSDVKLPPLNVALQNHDDFQPTSFKFGTTDEKTNEQDAVLSLMSLASPQSIKFPHSRTQSLTNNNTNAVSSPISSRSSSVHIRSPSYGQQPIPPPLPPFTRITATREKKPAKETKNEDSDATDVEYGDVTEDEE